MSRVAEDERETLGGFRSLSTSKVFIQSPVKNTL